MDNLLNILPVVPVRTMVMFPGMLQNLEVGREESLAAVDRSVSAHNNKVLLVAQKTDKHNIIESDLYRYGVVAELRQIIDLPDGGKRVLAEAVYRIKIQNFIFDEAEGWSAQYEAAPFIVSDDDHMELMALNKTVKETFERYVFLGKNVRPEVMLALKNQYDSGEVLNFVAGYLGISVAEKEEILEIPSLKEGLLRVYEALCTEIELISLQKRIQTDVQQRIEKNQKEYFLREQLNVINKELGEDSANEREEYLKKIAALPMNKEVADTLTKDVERLFKLPKMSPESAILRDYLDTVLGLPWGKYVEGNFDIKEAEKVLDSDHYGLDKIKERILEYLAVYQLTQSNKGPILCFVGPPGVGKTSLATSIAKAMKRKFTRMSLGGVSDEAEIRGHRRTYIGAMPGRLIRGVEKGGCLNPVFLLDEIDKLDSNFKGDPASALLEALDPEQNNTFSDHFVEVPFDLSSVFWVITANNMNSIPPALLDRLEIISLSGYTEVEKLKIAELHLLPKEIKANGLENRDFSVSEGALKKVIREYTREAGVRELERKIAKLCRKAALRIVKDGEKRSHVTVRNLTDYLGNESFPESDIDTSAAVGIATGLAWTRVGGELLKVEVLATEGKGALTLTGQLGKVMQESAKAAYTFIRSRAEELKLDKDFYHKKDVHIHLPEGAIPKDGPSAGITMVTAMVSALTGRKVKGELAMTGEVTLSGRVFPVGGIKEKMLAAHRYGIKTILLPERNVRDLDELPENVRKSINFIPVKHVDEVLKLALEEE